MDALNPLLETALPIVDIVLLFLAMDQMGDKRMTAASAKGSVRGYKKGTYSQFALIIGSVITFHPWAARNFRLLHCT
jgi:hypothetical protein